MRIIGTLLLSLFLFASCGGERDHKGKTPLVEVEGDVLFKEDLLMLLPKNLSKEDSLLFVERYIREWAEGILLYNKAKGNIPDNEKIDRLVENYRKALIIHTYQQELIEQKLSKEITEEDMRDYYQKNKELFVVDRPLVKGLFIKVPLSAPGIGNVRT